MMIDNNRYIVTDLTGEVHRIDAEEVRIVNDYVAFYVNDEMEDIFLNPISVVCCGDEE